MDAGQQSGPQNIGVVNAVLPRDRFAAVFRDVVQTDVPARLDPTQFLGNKFGDAGRDRQVLFGGEDIVGIQKNMAYQAGPHDRRRAAGNAPAS